MKFSYSIPAQKLVFLYDFENIKIAFCFLNDSLGSLKFCKWFLTKAYLKVLPSLLIILLLRAYMELLVRDEKVVAHYLACVANSNPRSHWREASYP